MTKTKDLTLEEWINEVDRQLTEGIGISLHDLPDVALAEWYEEGVSPGTAARRTLRYAQEG